MLEFLEIAKTDFWETFGGAWIFPVLIISIVWILAGEKRWGRKILLGILPLAFLFLYWCPISGMLFIKLLGDEVYWRILWLIPLAIVIPYAGCILLKRLDGIKKWAVFAVMLLVLAVCGRPVLSTEWFEPSVNAYKIPQYVIEVCDLLPSNIHAMVSNRLMPYIRQCDPTITLEYGRNALNYNGITETDSKEQLLYLEAQKSEIDLSVLLPLAREADITFLVFSNNRTYIGNWEDYGYREYGNTDEFCVFVDVNYEETQEEA